MSRADPKPGRWILPLVVAGIIGFTYTFVNALPAADVPSATTATTAAAAPTTTSTTTSSTTTTTLSPAVTAFLDVVAGFDTRATELVGTAQQLNDDWDARTIGFSDIREGLTTLRGDTDDFVAALEAAEVPEAAAELWTEAVTATESMATAADNMFDGLVNTEGPEKRLNSLEEYKAAQASLRQALTAAADAAS